MTYEEQEQQMMMANPDDSLIDESWDDAEEQNPLDWIE